MGKKFEQLPDYSRYKKEIDWNEKVKSPRTGEYYQADELDLKRVGLKVLFGILYAVRMIATNIF